MPDKNDTIAFEPADAAPRASTFPSFVPAGEDQKAETKRRKRKQEEQAALQRQIARTNEEMVQFLFQSLYTAGIFGPARNLSQEAQEQAKRNMGRIAVVAKSVTPSAEAVTIHLERGNITASAKKIAFSAMEDGKETEFDAAAAATMVLLASENPWMLKNGLKIVNGTEEQKQLIRAAVLKINSLQPEHKHLRIVEDEQPKTPKHDFTPAAAAPVAAAPVAPVTQTIAEPVDEVEQEEEPAQDVEEEIIFDFSSLEQELQMQREAPVEEAPVENIDHKELAEAVSEKLARQVAAEFEAEPETTRLGAEKDEIGDLLQAGLEEELGGIAEELNAGVVETRAVSNDNKDEPKPGKKNGVSSFLALLINGLKRKSGKNVESQETAPDESKKKNAVSRIMGRVFKPIEFRADRRFVGNIAAGAIATAVVFGPEKVFAADLVQEEPKKRSWLQRIFGRSKHYDEQKAGAGLQKKTTSKKGNRGKKSTEEPVQETKAQRKARLKQEAIKQERAKAKADAERQEARRQEARRLKKQKAEEAQKQKEEKRAPKKETAQQKKERLKREKEAAAEAKKTEAQAPKETRQQRREREKREKADAAKAEYDKNPQKNTKVGNGKVVIKCTHTGNSTTLNFGSPRSCQAAFNKVTKDWREGVTCDMAPGLITFLGRVVTDLRSKGHNISQVDIVAGFRTPQTNEMLIEASKKRNKNGKSGVAKHSFHLKGMALDFKIAGVGMIELRNSARRAGAWSYSAGDFVHMDTRGAYTV